MSTENLFMIAFTFSYTDVIMGVSHPRQAVVDRMTISIDKDAFSLEDIEELEERVVKPHILDMLNKQANPDADVHTTLNYCIITGITKLKRGEVDEEPPMSNE